MARLIIHTDKSINDKATKLIFGEQPPKVTRVNRYKNTDNVQPIKIVLCLIVAILMLTSCQPTIKFVQFNSKKSNRYMVNNTKATSKCISPITLKK